MRKTILALSLAALVVPAHADEREELEALRQTTMKLVDLLVQSGIVSKEKAEAMLKDARRSAQAAATAGPPEPGAPPAPTQRVVRVPYVPETVRKQIKDELRQEVMAQAEQERWAAPEAVPGWVKNLKLSGDLRLRQQYAYQSKDNGVFPDPGDVASDGSLAALNTTDDLSQSRLRLRLAVDFKMSEEFTGGVRIATGNTTNPVSTNQTLGQNGNRYSVTLDRAFLKYQPFPWLSFPNLGVGPTQVEVVAGRIANPWFSTDLVWDEDLGFDGFAATIRPRLADSTMGFLTLGAFPLQDLGCDSIGCVEDKRLFGGQIGFDHQPSEEQHLKAGLAVYEYRGITPSAGDLAGGTLTPPLGFRQKGNTSGSLADDPVLGSFYRTQAPLADFRLLNLTAVYEARLWDPLWLVLTGDWVKNIGYDSAQVALRRAALGLAGDYEERTTGYHANVLFGHPVPKESGEWNFSLGYKHLERDAVLDSFTDSDFHLGGTNAKGWILSGSYAVARNTWFRLRWLTANEIDGPPLAIDLLQLDLNARF